MSDTAVEVRDSPDESRFEAYVDGRLAGYSAYILSRGTLNFVHTEVDDAYEGQGLGSKLARGALDDARARHLAVVPLCPFIADYIERHPEYEELVAPGYRER